MATGKWLGAVKNAALEQSPWTTPHRHEELSGRSGSATRARRGCGSRSRGTNRVVVEPASVAPGCIEWNSSAYDHGLGGAELTQPHQLRKQTQLAAREAKKSLSGGERRCVCLSHQRRRTTRVGHSGKVR